MTEPAAKPNFILGVGAQKAGTTWLFDYLDSHPDCAMGPFKEMNFFRRSAQEPNGQVKRRRNPAWRMSLRIGDDNDARLAAEADARKIQRHSGHYAAIYRRLVTEHPGVRLIGDLSPKYGTLGVEDMTRMKSYLDGLDYPVRVVMLLRDPVRRCFSAARMAERGQGAVGRRARIAGGEDFSGEAFIRFATSPVSARRTQYEQMILRLEKVFAPEQIFYGLYEEFFAVTEIERLCAFLGITFHAPRFDHRPHADGRRAAIPEAAVEQVRAFYAETYAFCRDRFGAERIDALWG